MPKTSNGISGYTISISCHKAENSTSSFRAEASLRPDRQVGTFVLRVAGSDGYSQTQSLPVCSSRRLLSRRDNGEWVSEIGSAGMWITRPNVKSVSLRPSHHMGWNCDVRRHMYGAWDPRRLLYGFSLRSCPFFSLVSVTIDTSVSGKALLYVIHLKYTITTT